MTEWKPIDENTPKMVDVLVCRHDHKPVIAWYGDGSAERYPKGWNGAWFEPTHWMPLQPLPSPPERKE